MLFQHSSLPRAITRLVLAALTVLPLLGAGALAAQSTPTVSCPFAGNGTADLFHGIYVTGYTGTNLGRVTLGYTTTTPGLFSISLTAHRNSYDGPQIGTPQTATVSVATSGETLAIFDFGAAPVTPGDTIAFTQTASQLSSVNGQFGNLFFDAGAGACGSVFETQGTTPPLDSILHPGAGISITQAVFGSLGAPCVPSDTVLCVDDTPGDRRFRISASFATTEGGGRSGHGQAMPLTPLGAVHGGLLWFFSPGTPELLVKVLNGCAVNDHFWVFISATTNVGFTLTVDDTAFAASKTYRNPDLTPAPAVEDTAALASCHPCTSNAQCPTGLLCCASTPGTFCLAPTTGGTCPLIP